jgi:hypothetical protein
MTITPIHANQSHQPGTKCAFILRLWHDDRLATTSWRASIEIPTTGMRIGFANLEQLFAYLIDITESNCDLQLINAKEKENKNP